MRKFNPVDKMVDASVDLTDLLFLQPNFEVNIQTLLQNKPAKKIMRKAAEECMELATKLMQRTNDADKVTNEEIAEEIVDVGMHIHLLSKLFGVLVRQQVPIKTAKFNRVKDLKKYKNQIVKIK